MYQLKEQGLFVYGTQASDLEGSARLGKDLAMSMLSGAEWSVAHWSRHALPACPPQIDQVENHEARPAW